MEYRISNICSDLSIGKSTVYKRIELLKQSIPETDWKKNEYFYYTIDNKLFITEKGFEYIRNFKTKSNNIRQSSTNEITIYQNQIIDIYKSQLEEYKNRIEYLESENKRLSDIILFKEQKEVAKDIKYIGDNETPSFWDKFFNRFKR